MTRVQAGTPGEVVVLSYERLTPAPANDFTIVRAFVNDRRGFVTEYDYDSLEPPVARAGITPAGASRARR